MKNERRTVKNDEEFPQNRLQKRYGSTSNRFFFTKTCFLPKLAEMHSQWVMNILKQPPSPIYREKGRCLPPRGFLRKISKCTPITKFTPLFVLYGKVTEAVRKCFGFDFHLFFLFPFTNFKWNMLTQGFQKFYGSHGSPENHFSTTRRSLPPSCFLLKQPNFQNFLDGPRFKLLFTPLSW